MQATASPFDSPTIPVGDFDSIARESAIQMTKEEAVSEAKDLLSAARTIESQARFARKKKNWAWLGKLEAFAIKLGKALADFVQKAIVLAVFKFVAELCAMVLNSVMDSLLRRGGQKMDITTPNVLYTGGSGGNQAAPAQNQSYSGGDPFSRHYGNQPLW